MDKILIVEDDPDIAAIEQDYLIANGYEVVIVDNGNDGLEEGLSGKYNLILLDIMLPGMDGFTVCRQLREKIAIPILMVTAKHEDIDKIRGLGLGADDYIEKPFSPSVLVARIKANLAQYARLTANNNAGQSKSQIQLGDITLNTQTHRVFVNDKEVFLKNKEYELLLYMMLNLGTVLSRDQLYEQVWGQASLGDNATIAVHVKRVRDKIEVDPANPKHIQTVWGAGYRFEA